MMEFLAPGRALGLAVALCLGLMAVPVLAQTESFSFVGPDGAKISWTPTVSGTYRVTATGASGGDTYFFPALRGAEISATFTLSAGTAYLIAVGKAGDGDTFAAGGGGGTFFVEAGSPDTPLLVAAGGGGAGSEEWADSPATFVTTGPGPGGATSDAFAGGGGGFHGDGQDGPANTGGKSWLNGLAGGNGGDNSNTIRGGFGGGGSGHGNGSGGGGGGYVGGGVADVFYANGLRGVSFSSGADTTIAVSSSAAGALTIELIPVTPDNSDAAEASIATFLATRNQLLLSSGPDINRFIDRFSNAGTPGTVTILGYSAPIASAFDLQLGRDAAQFSYSSADGVAASDPVSQLAFWAKGDIARASGNTLFGIIHLGADYLVTDDVLLGIAGEIDAMSQDQGDATLSGTGYSVGPYATIRLSDNLFLDARLAGGQSFNSIAQSGAPADTFIGTRWLGSTSLVGRVDVGSVRIAPTARLSAITETTGAYVDHDGNDVGAVTATTGTAEIGPRISLIPDSAGGFAPYLGVNGVWTFLSSNSAGLAPDAALRARVETGATLGGADGMSARAGAWYDGLGTDWQAWGASFGLTAALP